MGRVRLGAVLIAAVAASTLVPIVAGRAAAPGGAVGATVGPLVAGTSSVVDGTFVWTDYAYDDRANDGAGDNGADLIQLQLRRSGDGVAVRAVLETLVDAKEPVVTVAIDTDGNRSTGAPRIPGLAWNPNGGLGAEVIARLATDGSVPTKVDPAANTIEATLPVRPGATPWRVWATVSVGDQPDVHDLAFVGGEPASGWQDTRQSSVIAGDLDAGQASAVVSADDLSGRVTRTPDIRTPGFHTLLYRSSLSLGEGIGQATLDGPGGHPVPVGDLYAGQYQPYLVWTPPSLPAKPPVFLYMHGFGGTHTSTASSFGPGKFDPAAVVVSPLGRGQNTFYIGAAEQDVLDAVDDAVARYDADPDRVVLSGVSMGGFGTFRLGVRHPDRWSMAVPFIGTGASAQSQFAPVPPAVRDAVFSPSHFAAGQAELQQNLANLPVRMVNGQIDPIVDNVLVTEDVQRLDSFGYDYRYWVLTRRHHEVVPSLSDCVVRDAITHRRDRDPARVVYSVEPAIELRDAHTGLDLRYRSAYWVSGLEVRDASEPGALGTIDATSLARADRSLATTPVNAVGQNFTAGADLCGPNPKVQTQDAWRLQGIERRPSDPQRTVNGVALSLDRLTAATLDLARARVATDRPVTVDVTGDGPAALRLAGAWRGPVSVTRDGVAAGARQAKDGAVVLDGDLSGHHVYVLTPR